ARRRGLRRRRHRRRLSRGDPPLGAPRGRRGGGGAMSGGDRAIGDGGRAPSGVLARVAVLADSPVELSLLGAEFPSLRWQAGERIGGGAARVDTGKWPR